MNITNFVKKASILGVSMLVASSAVPSTIAVASEVQSNRYDVDATKHIADTFELPSDTELRLFGFSDKDIEHVKEIVSADIQIVDGNIDKTTIPMSNNADATGYGKFSAAAKIILKGWNKLPKWLRNNVEGYVAISTFLKWIENATGTLQKAIYNACRKAGMNPTVANLVASGIMLLF